MRKPVNKLSIEEKSRLVIGVLGSEMPMSEAARRHGVSVNAVAAWQNRFVEAGTARPGRQDRRGSER